MRLIYGHQNLINILKPGSIMIYGSASIDYLLTHKLHYDIINIINSPYSKYIMNEFPKQNNPPYRFGSLYLSVRHFFDSSSLINI